MSQENSAWNVDIDQTWACKSPVILCLSLDTFMSAQVWELDSSTSLGTCRRWSAVPAPSWRGPSCWPSSSLLRPTTGSWHRSMWPAAGVSPPHFFPPASWRKETRVRRWCGRWWRNCPRGSRECSAVTSRLWCQGVGFRLSRGSPLSPSPVSVNRAGGGVNTYLNVFWTDAIICSALYHL